MSIATLTELYYLRQKKKKKKDSLGAFNTVPFTQIPCPFMSTIIISLLQQSSTYVLQTQILHFLFGPFKVLPSFITAPELPQHTVLQSSFLPKPKQYHHDVLMPNINIGFGLVFSCLYSVTYLNIDQLKKHKT